MDPFFPKIAPVSDKFLMIQGDKTDDLELVVWKSDEMPGDQIHIRDEDYSLKIEMPDFADVMRTITVILKDIKTGTIAHGPYVFELKIPVDPISLIIMDVVMVDGSTVETPNTSPSGLPLSHDMGKNTNLTITVYNPDNSVAATLVLTRIPAPNGTKPEKMRVQSAVKFEPRKGLDDAPYHYIENTTLGVAVTARWENTGVDTCTVYVYTTKRVVFS